MKKKIKILVTGVSSGVGQSIYKSLLLSKLNLDIFIGDINFLNIGLCQSKKYLKLPKVEKKNSLKKIVEILKKKKIDVLFIGSELITLSINKSLDVANDALISSAFPAGILSIPPQSHFHVLFKFNVIAYFPA